MLRCGGCGKGIWYRQPREFHNLSKNPVRPAMRSVPFHKRCWTTFPEDAK